MNNLFNLTGKTALITGGGGLLGPKHAEAIVEYGGNVILADWHEDRAREKSELINNEYGGGASYEYMDVTDKYSIQSVVDKYNNIVPDTFEELTSLPGVGRKTANCVLGYTFNKSTIAVDVHVHRISNRLGWVKTNKPEETEEELKKFLPKKSWIKVNAFLVDHGQRICQPIKPKCHECPILEYCEYGSAI